MFSTTDTIVALATPPGRAGLGVVRLSGPDAHRIVERLARRDRAFEPRRATVSRIEANTGVIDRAVVTTFERPHSYTGEDVAEISAHGSPVLLQTIVRSAIEGGARLAEPGEFTFRAFLNGQLDLVQAEAVRDLIDAVTPLQARAAFDQLEGTLTREIAEIDRMLFDLCARLEASLDFPGEGYHFVADGQAAVEIGAIEQRVDAMLRSTRRGRMVREGVQVVLAGRPNSGKSSLFNRLAGEGRAIVTDVPGTTRDLITEVVDVDGVPVTVVDTAGVRRSPGDAIEAEGIARATAARSVAALVLVLLDGSTPLTDDDRALLEDTHDVSRIVVRNKSDLGDAWPDREAGEDVVAISALTGEGLDELRHAIVTRVGGEAPSRDVPAITNLRHAELLTQARSALARASAAAAAGVPEEFVLADLNAARAVCEEITGKRTPDDVLAAIFSKFCIGK